jgi:hypothetical protein
MKKSLIGWLFAFVAVGLLKKGMSTPIGAILVPLTFIAYFIWFFSGMPGVK